MTQRLMLLDLSYLAYRAYLGIPETLRAPDGTPVNAVRGVLDFTARLVTQYSPTRLVACLDADWRPDFRVAAVPSYKAHRVAADGEEETPDTLTPQLPVIEAALTAFGIPQLGVAGYEADDVIGTLATSAAGPVDIVTGDRDLFQLVDDAREVRVLYTALGVSKHEIVDEAAISARYGIPGRGYADYALLRGDPSDGLPGVARVGDKTAAALVTRYGSVEALLAALDSGDPGITAAQRRHLEAGRDYLRQARVVVDVARDVPVPAGFDSTLPGGPADPEQLAALVERWGLGGSAGRLGTALAGNRS